MEPFEDAFNSELIDGISRGLAQAYDDFHADRFERLAKEGLADLELRARSAQIGSALLATRSPRTSTRPRDDPSEAVRAHNIRPISMRRYYPGRHRVELVANGRTLASGEFELEM